jgi:radical SAM superfamily enzyme YgiQ (UPF0313 family)
MSLKVLLVNPNNSPSMRILLLTSGITPPLGLGYLASYLRQAGIKVSIIDNTIELLSSSEFVQRFEEIDPDVVGFTALTSVVNNALALAKIIKANKPTVKIIFGGSHASALPRDLLKDEAVDIVIRGEGEETLLEVVRAISQNDIFSGINGIVYKYKGEIIENSPRVIIKNIDDIPFPAFDLLPMSKYSLPSSRRLTSSRVASVITTRGCPYHCSFCSKIIFKDSVRMRSPQNVISEMELLVKKFEVGELVIWDDNFNLDPKRAIEICELMVKKSFGLTWTCSNRANLFSEELCCALYDAGCRLVNFGVESGNQNVRDSIKKQINEQDIYKAIRLCRKHKLMVTCSFILGLPGETYESACETLQFAKELEPDYGIFCMFVPMPGSELFELLEKDGIIKIDQTDWGGYVPMLSASPPVVELGSMTKKELVDFQKKVFREFYLRPSYIFGTLLRIRGIEGLKSACRGLNAIVSHQFAKIV